MSIGKKSRRWMFLLIVTLMMLGSASQAQAYALRIRFRIRVTYSVKRRVTITRSSSSGSSKNKKKANPALTSLYTVLFQGDTAELELYDQDTGKTLKNVKWSVSNKKLVKLRKRGGKAYLTSKNKEGKTKVTAKYKGKKYRCTVSCHKGFDTDVISLNGEAEDGNYTAPLVINQGATEGDWVAVFFEETLISRQFPRLFCESENPNIAVCQFEQDSEEGDDTNGFYYEYDDEESDETGWGWHYFWLIIKGVDKGSTRIRIWNSYNNEVEYIPVTIV